ncbi:MAG: Tetratricopeptide repeat [Pseudomonadota bacterium]
MTPPRSWGGGGARPLRNASPGRLLAVALALTLAGCTARDVAAGEDALARGDLVAAEIAWRRVLEDDPTRAEALHGLGWTLHLAGRQDLARDTFARLDALHPESALGPRGLGSVALAAGNVAVARERFQNALARTPGDLGARQGLALVALASGDPAAALTALEPLIVEAPDRVELHLARVRALLAAERPEDAAEASGEALRRAADASPRLRGQAAVMRARALAAASAGRVRPARCASAATAVRAWLDEADRVLDAAEAEGVRPPELPDTRRAVLRQRRAVDAACPPGVGG